MTMKRRTGTPYPDARIRVRQGGYADFHCARESCGERFASAYSSPRITVLNGMILHPDGHWHLPPCARRRYHRLIGRMPRREIFGTALGRRGAARLRGEWQVIEQSHDVATLLVECPNCSLKQWVVAPGSFV